MADKRYFLAIDSGTISSKALLVAEDGAVVARSRNFIIVARHPQADWIEFDPREMLDSVISAAKDAVCSAGINTDQIAAIGFANQGETVIAFDSDTGEPVYPAISWQDRRTLDIVSQWRADGLEPEVIRRTGLRLDPYFSASKFRWILDNVPSAKELLPLGRLRLGTSDSWLIRQISGGSFITDVSTASRTMLLNLETLSWDEDLLNSIGIPENLLPRILPNSGAFSSTSPMLFDRPVPITGLCVDQQAALFGQRCLREGQAKATYGTGCFVLANAGPKSAARKNGLLTSVGWKIETSPSYVFDGGIYCAGSIIDWLRNELRLFSNNSELESLAGSAEDSGGVFLFPAFTGLASPHWEPAAKAAFLGLTLGSRREHIIRAALEAIAFRVKDIIDAVNSPRVKVDHLQVDGGLANSDFLMQLQSDLLGVTLRRAGSTEATAMGVAMMAGIGAGIYKSIDDLPLVEPPARVFEPGESAVREQILVRYATWRRLCEELILLHK